MDRTYELMKSYSEGLKECSTASVDSMASVDPSIGGKNDASAVAETDGTSLIKRCEIREQANELKGQVTRFLGYAIKGTTDKWRRLAHQGDDCDDTEDDCCESDALEYIEDMSILHHEAIRDEWYMRNCYSAVDQLRNRGYLTLVAPHYFKFGNALMTFISGVFTMKKITTGGRGSIEESFKQLSENEELWAMFLGSSKSLIPQETKRKIYVELLKKAYHARIGVVTDLFNELQTGHYATNASGLSLRSELQGVTKKSSEQAASGAKRKIMETQL